MIIDACGIGSMPDWKDYDEVAVSNTLANTCKFAHENLNGIKLPNLQEMGIANITDLAGLAKIDQPSASFGKMAELNDAKDTITGHWEMMGIKMSEPFKFYPEGFPEEILEEFKKQTGVKGILANCAASGTQIINELGDEHLKTGYPIIYTSADSVLQLACHVDVVDLETQYKWSQIARDIMRGEHEVARIITRPFTSNPNYKEDGVDNLKKPASEQKYIRLNDKRHDYSILPPTKSVLKSLLEKDIKVLGMGKIQDIFAGDGVPRNIKTKDNDDGMQKFIDVLKTEHEDQLIFLNLVETDCNYGHRRDPKGFAEALEAIDRRIPEVLAALTDEDALFITADHGCDPTAAGSDHTREYVPMLFYNKKLVAKDLGTRESFADLGATILNWFKIEDPDITIKGKSFL